MRHIAIQRCCVQRLELADAMYPNERTCFAYDARDIEPIACALRAREPFREVDVRLRDAGDSQHVASLSAAPFVGGATAGLQIAAAHE